ncbi:putative calcium calmodulin dependent protein [Erysiphe necator]|uniref:Putative calcium calmodulin dependent protein n=1 Tax=Uncinula necator TaxID=52586 RepID=A0A0B1NYF8_UNCNE|nr:putative calcium calmodulin dependent protein [Erysiphe necator]
MEALLVGIKSEILCSHLLQKDIQQLNNSDQNHQPTTANSHKKKIKETLNATSRYVENEYGITEHHINQYIVKGEIGHGSFGAVHYATDLNKNEYAIKKVSKSRLRRRSRTSIINKSIALGGPSGSNKPCTAQSLHLAQQFHNPLFLIKGDLEVARKVNHPNILQLIEVLDDPEEDSLYMVLEYCMKGVITEVAIGEKANPQSPENCRIWFRQMVSGLEHLHENGIVHRDIKPENLLLTKDNVLKIADFGDSEIFEKGADMMIFKSAGSPAFTPPELCVRNHGYVSGKAADIWSLGVSLYCIRFGHLPFERIGILELYEAIKTEELKFDVDPTQEPDFQNLMMRLLDKDPNKRAKIDEIKVHPWITNCDSATLPNPVMDVSEESTKTQVKEILTFEKRKDLPLLTNQQFDPEENYSIIYRPTSLRCKQNIDDENLEMNNNDREPRTQINLNQEVAQYPECKSLRPRLDSGIELNDFEFTNSINSVTEFPS